MTEAKAALVWCPFPDTEAAREIAATLLREKLIACANILPTVESVFEWKGKVENGTEAAVLFKTTEDRLDMLVTRLGECHPYDTPAIVGWKSDATHPQTINWLHNTLGDA